MCNAFATHLYRIENCNKEEGRKEEGTKTIETKREQQQILFVQQLHLHDFSEWNENENRHYYYISHVFALFTRAHSRKKREK